MAGETDWLKMFPGLTRLSEEMRDRLTRSSMVVSLAEGSRIYGPGQAPEAFLLLLEGTVRVQQVSENGREIVLYRVHAGESCALTTACLMSYEDYLAEAIAETLVRAVAVPRPTFDELIARSAEFRQLVFTAFSQRVTNLFRVIEDVAFGRMDLRLADKLIELSPGSDQISVTQQQLASELGTAREVVSRLLSEFQRRGFIQSGRGSITIQRRGELEALVRMG
ncbi:MAG: Crp/Fnr family transcriptional regulator [Hyphomicrobiaceae bacterium]